MDQKIIAYFLKQLSAEERIDLLRERETDEEMKKDFAGMQNLQAMIHLHPANTNREEGEEQYARIQRKVKQKRLWFITRRIAGYAAAVIVTFMATWTLMHIQEAPSEVASTQQELYVPAGQRARITLPDGSTAWLNAGSSLTYPSVFEKERKVQLEGEGFFEVAKDTEKPFIVVAGDLEVKALGTQFNVYNYTKAKRLSATLTEGSILVYPTGKERDGYLLQPNQRITMENNRFTLENLTDMDELLWREGIYSFRKERMHSIVKKLELYFDVEIEVKNKQILDYEYTGKFRQRDGVLEILRIIQKIHHFKIENNEDLSRITLS